MFFVYVLLSRSTGHFYTGITDNLGRRLQEHNANKNLSTKNRGPWILFYSEHAKDSADARIREKYLKSGAGREKLKRLLCGGSASVRLRRTPADKMADAVELARRSEA